MFCHPPDPTCDLGTTLVLAGLLAVGGGLSMILRRFLE